jgi:probable HAF family extracellular repeat protein/autotransporter-associated beta strand protein
MTYFLSAASQAATFSWKVASGNWSVASNWGGIPTNNYYALIVNGGSSNITQTGETCGTLSLGGSAGSGTIQMTAGSLATTAALYVGDSGVGSFMQSGGTNLTANLGVGENVGGTGMYSLSGSGQLFSSSVELIGVFGTGSFTQSGGSNHVGFLYVGSDVSSTYNLSGSGWLYTNYQYIRSSGSFSQSGGTNNATAAFTVDGPAGDGSTYNLSGSGFLLSSNSEVVGSNGQGSFTQSGGTNNSGPLYLGYNSSASGTYSLSGSGLLVGGDVIGYSGTGSFTQSGGTNNASEGVQLGALGGVGMFSLSVSGLLSSSVEYVGGEGTGGFIQSGGSNGVSTLYVGYGLGRSGTYSLGGSGQLSSGSEAIGYFGAGSFAQSGGTNNAGSLYLGYDSRSSGSYNLNGGLLTLFSLSGGSGYAAFGFNGGILSAGTSFSTNLPMTLGTSGGGRTFDTAGFSVILAGSLSGPGSLTKADSGSLILTAFNSYTGPTSINQGELMVNGSLVSPVTVNSGGTLAGTGSMANVTVNSGGHLAPGDAPGILSLSGSLTLLSGAVMDYKLDTPLDSDMVLMTSGALNLNGQQFSDFNFTPLAGFGPGSYTLIDAGTVIGSLGSGTSGMIDGVPANIAVQGDNLVLTVVPEPGTLVLLGIGGLVLLARPPCRRVWRAICPGVFAMLAACGTHAASVQYTVTDLGTLPQGSLSAGIAINNSGEAAGHSSIGASGPGYAVVFSGGTVQNLGTLAGYSYSSDARAINNIRQIAGTAYTYSSTGEHAFLYSSGTMQDLGTLGGANSWGAAISNSGQVVGTASNILGDDHAFLYSGGTMQDLGTLGGRLSNGYAINDSGQIVGSSVRAAGGIDAFLWINGMMQDLGRLPGGGNSVAQGINNYGQIVGWAYNSGMAGRAFLYSNGTMQDLGTPPGYTLSSNAFGINDSGQIVGYALDSNSSQHAFLYSDGTMKDLNSLIAPSPAWDLEDAYGINNLGQIVGVGVNPGGQTHAVLLTPTPEPSTFALLTATVLALLAFAFRHRRLTKS